MKRLLSLVLSLVMLCGVGVFGVSASAADAKAPVGMIIPYLEDSRVYTYSDLFGSALVIGSEEDRANVVYTSWFDYCPKDGCGGIAVYSVVKGNIEWHCTKCGDHGTYIYKPNGSEITYTVVCPTCKSGENLKFLETVVKDGKTYDIYYCAGCKELVYAAHDDKIDPSGVRQTVTCHVNNCGKTAKLDKLYLDGCTLVATYVCEDGHTSTYILDEDIYGKTKTYTVTVEPSAYGDYAIRSSATAKYGETKTVVFYPKTGYELVDVKVNGKSVTITNNQVSFKVYGNTVVTPVYAKTYLQQSFTVALTSTGNGTVSAKRNGTAVSADKITANGGSTLTYTFTPATRSYQVTNVVVDGKSVGAPTTYTLKDLSADHTIKVTFGWKCPYADVESKYLKAVEFVTETGLMGAYRQDSKLYFSGRTAITVGNFVSVLAELADTSGKLSNETDRRNWAIAQGIVAKATDFTAVCNVQTACGIVVEYLKVMEKLNKVTFTKLNTASGVKQAAIGLNLVTEKTYDGNRDLHRYDLASICRLIARLEYKG